jgi:hypothetical protein
MQADDLVAEWLVLWEEARAAGRPPPALDELPAGLRPLAREGLRLLGDFAVMAQRLTGAAPAPPGDAPPVPPATPRYRFEGFLGRGGMAEVWRGTDTVLAREVALKVLRDPVFGGAAGTGPGSRRRPATSPGWGTRRSCRCRTWAIVPDSTICTNQGCSVGACMRKLVMLCYGVHKNRAPFEPAWSSRITR